VLVGVCSRRRTVLLSSWAMKKIGEWQQGRGAVQSR